jgi:hypothetical protein
MKVVEIESGTKNQMKWLQKIIINHMTALTGYLSDI